MCVIKDMNKCFLFLDGLKYITNKKKSQTSTKYVIDNYITRIIVRTLAVINQNIWLYIHIKNNNLITFKPPVLSCSKFSFHSFIPQTDAFR